MAVSGDASIGYSIDSAFSAERSYSLFSYNETIVSCEFNDWGQSVNKNTLATAISALNLQPFNPQDATIIASYRSLFEVLGSHIVVGCTCGGRLQMVCIRLQAE
jgi:hypothetical protein